MFSVKAFSAVGCDLNDPDREVKRFFPNSTGYKTGYFSIKQVGGKVLLEKVEIRLGDKFQGLFEKYDIPYTIYTVYKNKQKVGYIHGVNQKSTYGGMQVFLILDTKGAIKNFYIQKLTSKASRQFRSKEFGKQFMGLTLKDFEKYNPQTKTVQIGSKVAKIQNPSLKSEKDFRAILRGVKKNLILMDIFILNPITINEVEL